MSQTFSSLSPQFQDTERVLLAKILTVLNNGGGGGGGVGWTHGAGSPIANGVSATAYGTYTNDSDSTFWIVSNGTWIKLV
jgi:hypothetical protein